MFRGSGIYARTSLRRSSTLRVLSHTANRFRSSVDAIFPIRSASYERGCRGKLSRRSSESRARTLVIGVLSNTRKAIVYFHAILASKRINCRFRERD